MITRKEIKSWMDANVCTHTLNGDVNMTTLGEECAEHFGLTTELGDSSDEQLIFDIATEYFSG